MKFVQKPLGESANVSSGQAPAHWDYLRIVIMIATGFLVINLFVWVTVEIVVRCVSVEQEASLFSFLRADEPESPELALFQQVLDTLVEHPHVPAYPYQLTVIDSNEPNAFAIAGGAIGITKELIKRLDDDEIAIAFLLGHELGHFANRDHLRGAGRTLLLAGCQSCFFPQGGADLLSGMTVNTIVTGYSRKQEEKADIFGLRLVYECYGEADGALRLMELLREMKSLPEWAYMFTTHPGPEKRIRLLEAELKRLQADTDL